MIFGPITDDWIAEYARTSGDDNPLHASFPGHTAIVHGALLAAIGERYLHLVLPDAHIHSMSFRFLRPVKAGDSVAYSLGNARRLTVDSIELTEQRLTARISAGRPCLMASFTYSPASG